MTALQFPELHFQTSPSTIALQSLEAHFQTSPSIIALQSSDAHFQASVSTIALQSFETHFQMSPSMIALQSFSLNRIAEARRGQISTIKRAEQNREMKICNFIILQTATAQLCR
ncbi:MAG: hypothetical protein O7G88_14100 [bacterium]|nr:hypothetical protein [bacterium]